MVISTHSTRIYQYNHSVGALFRTIAFFVNLTSFFFGGARSSSIGRQDEITRSQFMISTVVGGLSLALSTVSAMAPFPFTVAMRRAAHTMASSRPGSVTRLHGPSEDTFLPPFIAVHKGQLNRVE
jgi:hypothetical protein